MKNMKLPYLVEGVQHVVAAQLAEVAVQQVALSRPGKNHGIPGYFRISEPLEMTKTYFVQLPSSWYGHSGRRRSGKSSSSG